MCQLVSQDLLVFCATCKYRTCSNRSGDEKLSLTRPDAAASFPSMTRALNTICFACASGTCGATESQHSDVAILPYNPRTQHSSELNASEQQCQRTSLQSRATPPAPGKIPMRVSGKHSFALSVVSRTSQPRAASSPQPKHGPLMAATVGTGTDAKALAESKHSSKYRLASSGVWLMESCKTC